MREQPRWTWFMCWGDPIGMWREREAVLETYQADETFTLTDLPWVSVKHPRIHYPIIR